MTRIRLSTAALAATALTFAVLPGTAARAAVDSTPPTAPVLLSSFGYQCLEIQVFIGRATDDVTPQRALRYEIYSDGEFIEPTFDRGAPLGIRAAAYAKVPGPTTITVRAFDAAGNGSPHSNGIVTETTKEPCR